MDTNQIFASLYICCLFGVLNVQRCKINIILYFTVSTVYKWNIFFINMEKRKDFKVNNDPYLECTLIDEEMKNYLSNLENLKFKICYFYERNGWCKYKSDCKYLHQKKIKWLLFKKR